MAKTKYVEIPMPKSCICCVTMDELFNGLGPELMTLGMRRGKKVKRQREMIKRIEQEPTDD